MNDRARSTYTSYQPAAIKHQDGDTINKHSTSISSLQSVLLPLPNNGYYGLHRNQANVRRLFLRHNHRQIILP